MGPTCPVVATYQVQFLMQFIVGLAGQILAAVSSGLSTILTDVGSVFTGTANNCSAMAMLTTGIFGNDGGLIYWINQKQLDYWILHLFGFI